jgi:hypothetical protein
MEARIAPARDRPLWYAADSKQDPSADPLPLSAPAFEFDLPIVW